MEQEWISIDKIIEKEAEYSQKPSIETIGRVHSSRASKHVSFADIGGFGSLCGIQLVFDKEVLTPEKLPIGSVLRIEGKLLLCPDKSHQREIKVLKIIYLSKPELDPALSIFPWARIEAPQNERAKWQSEAKQRKEDEARTEKDRQIRLQKPEEKISAEIKKQKKVVIEQKLKAVRKQIER